MDQGMQMALDDTAPNRSWVAGEREIAAGQAGARLLSAGPAGPASHRSPQPGSVLPQWQDPAASWIVIQHRADDGARVRLGVRRLGFEVHWPRKVHRAPRRDDVIRPVFPGYLFALAERRSASWHAVRDTVANVVGIVGVRETGSPVHPPRGFVLRLVRDAGGALDGVVPPDEDRGLSAPTFEAGDEVEIVGTAFAGLRAIYQADADERVRVLLQVLGVTRPVMVPRDAVAKVGR